MEGLSDPSRAALDAALSTPPEHLAARRAAERGAGILFEVMRRLRGPDGCPWDREQTPDSLVRFLVEECYEALEAIELGEPAAICEELGDLLFQVVFHAEIFRERGAFALGDVATGIAEKLWRRHPHVFGDEPDKTHDGISRRWEALKRAEREAKGAGPVSALDGVPRALPALARAQKLQARAARVGFDWPNVGGVWHKLDEERGELHEAVAAGDAAAVRSEVGDLLFTCVNLARFFGVEAEEALADAAGRFDRRFRVVEEGLAVEQRTPRDATIDELEARWQDAKRVLAAGASPSPIGENEADGSPSR